MAYMKSNIYEAATAVEFTMRCFFASLYTDSPYDQKRIMKGDEV